MTSNFNHESETLRIDHILKSRGWIYQFLAKNFHATPNFKALKELNENNLLKTLKESGEQNEGLETLVNFIDKSSGLTDKEEETIKNEFQRLFYGPGHLPAPPWESVYRSEEKIIFDEHTLAVREFYRKWGVTVNKDKKEPDDHIGLQLDFIAILIQRGISALDENNIEKFKEILIEQKNFLENHLLIWVDEFCGNLEKSTNLDLYRGMALFTPYYLKMDKELLEELISNIEKL